MVTFPFLHRMLCRWQIEDCGCKKRCTEKFQDPCLKQRAMDFHLQCDKMSSADASAMRHRLLVGLCYDSSSGTHQRPEQYMFLGQPVCFQAWLWLVGISKNWTVRRLESILAGNLDEPADGRQQRVVRDKPGTYSADAFFDHLYVHMAEHLAECRPDDDEDLLSDVEDDLSLEVGEPPILENKELPLVSQFDEWILGRGSSADPLNVVVTHSTAVDSRPQKYLHQTKLSELYQQYLHKAKMESEKPCSASTFYKTWKRWHSVIKIRKVKQHARCEDCAKYSKFRAKARTEAMKAEIEESYANHLKSVYKDREIGTRLASASRASLRDEAGIPDEERVLYISIDAMDEATHAGICFSPKKRKL